MLSDLEMGLDDLQIHDLRHSFASDDASEEDGRDGDDQQQNQDSYLQGLCLRVSGLFPISISPTNHARLADHDWLVC